MSKYLFMSSLLPEFLYNATGFLFKTPFNSVV